MDDVEHLLGEFHNKRLNVHLLERMSVTFKWDFQRMLITQILSILRAQELRYEIKHNTFGDEELVVLSSVHEMREMCQPYINEIKNVKLLTSKLNELFEEVGHIFIINFANFPYAHFFFFCRSISISMSYIFALSKS